MRKSLFEYSKDKKGIKTSFNEKDLKSEFTKEKLKSSFEKSGLDENEVRKKVDSYSKLSKNELLGELYKEIDRQKSVGSFNFNQLESQLDNMRPMLNDKQKASLESILKNLKG